jgi:nucleoside-triphosphatase THEP1
MLAHHPWADAIKRRPEVEILTVTRANRDQVREKVRRWLEPT